MAEQPIYYLVTINRRGQVTETAFSVDRADVVAEQRRILAAHPGWTCRVKVWR